MERVEHKIGFADGKARAIAARRVGRDDGLAEVGGKEGGTNFLPHDFAIRDTRRQGGTDVVHPQAGERADLRAGAEELNPQRLNRHVIPGGIYGRWYRSPLVIHWGEPTFLLSGLRPTWPG